MTEKNMQIKSSLATTPDQHHPMPPYFERHIFFCLNERRNGEVCCAQHQALEAFERCKTQVKVAGLAGPGKVRVNKAGCLDRCADGPVAVVYPEGVWYTYVDNADIDEIVESHLKQGMVVTRLLLPAGLEGGGI